MLVLLRIPVTVPEGEEQSFGHDVSKEPELSHFVKGPTQRTD